MSWGHDEYTFRVAGRHLPLEAQYGLRYHSFYLWRREGAYTELTNDQDRAMLPWIRLFNTYDLYTKADGRTGLAPWLNRSLPVRMDRKVVAVMQMLGLVVASSGVLPTPYAQGLLAVSLTALCWSFDRDVLWLWQRRDAPRQAEMDS